MATAIYAGSFDPFTNGHLNILNHAASIFDKVYVAVMTNPKKNRLADSAISTHMIRGVVSEGNYNNVEVIFPEEKLLYLEAKRLGCDYIVRGIRNNGLDYPYEENMADFNKEVGGINTIFFRADVDKNISSTMIKTLLERKQDISKYVPTAVARYFNKGL